MRLVRQFWFLLAFLAVFASDGFPAPDRSLPAYKKAAEFYRNIKPSPKNGPRKELERSLGLFTGIYTNYPRGSKTPDALYMSGQIHEDLYRKYRKSTDRENALTIYRVLVRSYPSNPLSDNALYRSGEIHLRDGKKIEALADFRGVVRWFPRSGSAQKAKEMIASLEKEVQDAKRGAKKILVKKEPEEADFKGVRHWGNAKYARVVFDLGKSLHYKVTLNAEGDALTVDLVGIENPSSDAKPLKPQNSLVDSIQIGALNKGISRILIHLNHAVTFASTELSNPKRIVVDINRNTSGSRVTPTPSSEAMIEGEKPTEALPSSPSVREASAGMEPPSLPKPDIKVPMIEPLPIPLPSPGAALGEAGIPPLETGKESSAPPDSEAEGRPEKASYSPLKQAKVRTIVLDPGHGGKDPGAIGKGGLMEKDITLDIAFKLRKLIQKECGCRVLMTRQTDVFIPLEERTAFANTMEADLFVSIHGNSSLNRKASGIETYFLSPARSKGESYVAARENMLSMNSEDQDMNDLAFILFDMKNTDKINESSRMASIVQSSIVQEVRSGAGYRARDNGVKQAMFYVLHGARMPAILVETSYISNPKEEHFLRDAGYREEIARGIARGVMSYSHEARIASLEE